MFKFKGVRDCYGEGQIFRVRVFQMGKLLDLVGMKGIKNTEITGMEYMKGLM